MQYLRNTTTVASNLGYDCMSLWFSGGMSLLSVMFLLDALRDLTAADPRKVLFGLVIALIGWPWFIYQLRGASLFRRGFGEDTAEISKNAVAPGDEFEFIFIQPIKQRTRIDSVTVYLVYNECVTIVYVNDFRVHQFDRPFHEEVIEGRVYGKGERLKAQCNLCLPTGDLGIRNPYMNRTDARLTTQWKIKVVVQPAGGSPFRREYALEPILPAQGQPEAAANELAGLFDVFLVDADESKKWTLFKALDKALPYTDAISASERYSARPCLIQERLQKDAAEKFKGDLETAGGVAEIRPATLETAPS